MRASLRYGLLAAWALWTVWVVVHYFTIPSPIPDAPPTARWHDVVDLFDRALTPLVFWREALARAAWAAIGAGAVLAAGGGLGAVVMPHFDAMLSGVFERALVRLALGLALLSWICLALAEVRAYRPLPLITVLVIGLVFGLSAAIRRMRGSLTAARDSLRRHVHGVDVLYLVCAVAAIAFAFAGALAPETEYDALWYHLWLPHQWLQAGRPVDRVDEYVSLYPLHWELLYGAAMTMGGPIAAKLLHFACLPLTAGTAALLTRRISAGSSPWLAAALTVCTPIVIWEATTAYIDLALAWYVALAAYSAFRFHASRDRRWLFLCAVFIGVAMSIKHLGLIALAVACVLVALAQWAAGRSVGHALMTGFAVIAIALLPALPWYARAFARSGNPVFPDLYGVFGAKPAERWSVDAERGLDAFKAHFGPERTLTSIATLPWDATVHAARYGGTLGPLFLIFVPLAVAVPAPSRRRVAMVAAACAMYAAVWASPVSSFQMRFLVPLVPLLAVLAAVGISGVQRAARSSGAVRLVSAVVGVFLVVNLPPFIRWHEPDRSGWDGWLTHVMRVTPAPVVLGAESQAAYLGRMVRSYKAWRFIDGHLPADARVLTFPGGDHLYATRDRVSADAAVARPMTWGALGGQEAAVLHAAAKSRVTHVLFDTRTSVSALAIGSERMRACCLEPLYEDADMTLYRLKLETMLLDGREGTDEARSSATP
jgi:hypothetical protein